MRTPSFKHLMSLLIPLLGSEILIGQETSLRYFPVTPCRVFDTRSSALNQGYTILGASEIAIRMTGTPCNLPAGKAWALNLTVVPGNAANVTLWADGAARPNTVTIVNPEARVIAQNAIIPGGPGGAIKAWATQSTHIIIDVNGYFDSRIDGLSFVPVTPCRVADTRLLPNGPTSGPFIAAGETRPISITASPCGIPSSAQAVALNSTVVPLQPGQVFGYLTVFPTGSPRPEVSTLNNVQGRVVANGGIYRTGTNGQVSFFADSNTHLVVDVTGYFAPSAPGGMDFTTIPPCRVVGDANGVINVIRGLDPVTFQDVPGANKSFSPANCVNPGLVPGAYAATVTVTPTASLGYVTVWPSGGPRPVVSLLNAVEGMPVGNGMIAPAGWGAQVSLFASTAAAGVNFDVTGYFTYASGANEGWLDSVSCNASGVTVSGWAADMSNLNSTSTVTVDIGTTRVNQRQTSLDKICRAPSVQVPTDSLRLFRLELQRLQ